jgi:hypothetical protein
MTTENGAATSPAANSAFINHLGQLPAVNDGVTYFKEHPLGQKSIALSSSAYDTVVKASKPLSPYIAKANDYASPYVHKADELADSGLGRVEERFPIIKEPTDKIKATITKTVTYPQKRASDIYASGSAYAAEQRDYVFKVYSDEYKKIGEKGYIPMVKATIITSVILSTQLYGWLAAFVCAKKKEGQETVEQKTQQ